MEVTRRRRLHGNEKAWESFCWIGKGVVLVPHSLPVTNRLLSRRVSNGNGASKKGATFAEFLGAEDYYDQANM